MPLSSASSPSPLFFKSNNNNNNNSTLLSSTISTSTTSTSTLVAIKSLLENAVTVRSMEVRRHCARAIEDHVQRLIAEEKMYFERISDQDRKLEDLSWKLDAFGTRERELQQDLDAKVDQLQKLKRANSQLPDPEALQALEHQIQRERGKHKLTKQQLQELREERDTARHQVQLLTGDREELVVEIDREKSAKLSAQKALLAVNERNFELTNKAMELEALCQQQQIRIEEIQLQLSSTSKRCKELVAASIDSNRELALGESQHQLKLQMKVLDDDKQKLKEENLKLESLLSQKIAEIERLKWNAERDADKTLEEAKKSSQVLLKKSDKLKKRKTEIEHLKSEITTKQQLIDDMKAQLAQLQVQGSSHDHDVSRLKEDLIHASSQLKTMGDKNQQLMNVIHQQEVHIAEMKEEISTKQHQNDVLSGNCDALRIELREKQMEANENAAQVHSARRGMQQLQNNASLSDQQLSQVNLELMQLQQEKRALEESLTHHLHVQRQLEASLGIKDQQLASMLDMNARLTAQLKTKEYYNSNVSNNNNNSSQRMGLIAEIEKLIGTMRD